VKLLFDANLSPTLVRRLAELFPGLTHVFDAGLARFTPDSVIWEYAAQNGFVIVTADSDFVRLSQERGSPPKVIRIEKCTFKTAEVEHLIRCNAVRITEFWQSDRPLLLLRKTL
jgi:predicted nuclease of predicted toxin-antitoxin system